jgi:hypothetical protein
MKEFHALKVWKVWRFLEFLQVGPRINREYCNLDFYFWLSNLNS